mmetsp:Transcript_38482/g.115425  ORF Transcript_38482/g.115425 Transcript_38482/m.115425 type:complete len:204 (-) Transcript_38482:793-1404(-)
MTIPSVTSSSERKCRWPSGCTLTVTICTPRAARSCAITSGAGTTAGRSDRTCWACRLRRRRRRNTARASVGAKTAGATAKSKPCPSPPRTKRGIAPDPSSARSSSAFLARGASGRSAPRQNSRRSSGRTLRRALSSRRREVRMGAEMEMEMETSRRSSLGCPSPRRRRRRRGESVRQTRTSADHAGENFPRSTGVATVRLRRR